MCLCGWPACTADGLTSPLPASSGAVGSSSWNHLAYLGTKNLIAFLGKKGAGIFFSWGLAPCLSLHSCRPLQPGPSSLPQLLPSCQGWPLTVCTGQEGPQGCHRRITHSPGLRTLVPRGVLLSIRELECLWPIEASAPKKCSKGTGNLPDQPQSVTD